MRLITFAQLGPEKGISHCRDHVRRLVKVGKFPAPIPICYGTSSGEFFVVNALMVPYLLSAIRMVETGFATVEDVDKAVVAGLSHPMGPLRLSDLVGLDTLKLIADKMFEEFKAPHYGPPPLLLRMVEAGLLGKKSGQGFYSY